MNEVMHVLVSGREWHNPASFDVWASYQERITNCTEVSIVISRQGVDVKLTLELQTSQWDSAHPVVFETRACQQSAFYFTPDGVPPILIWVAVPLDFERVMRTEIVRHG